MSSGIEHLNVILPEINPALTEKQWQQGLIDLSPFERPALKRPAEFPAMNLVAVPIMGSVPSDEEIKFLGRGIRHLHVFMGHLIRLQQLSLSGEDLPKPFDKDGLFFLKALCGAEWKGFMVDIEYGYFGFTCSEGKGLYARDGDVLLLESR